MRALRWKIRGSGGHGGGVSAMSGGGSGGGPGSGRAARAEGAATEARSVLLPLLSRARRRALPHLPSSDTHASNTQTSAHFHVHTCKHTRTHLPARTHAHKQARAHAHAGLEGWEGRKVLALVSYWVPAMPPGYQQLLVRPEAHSHSRRQGRPDFDGRRPDPRYWPGFLSTMARGSRPQPA